MRLRPNVGDNIYYEAFDKTVWIAVVTKLNDDSCDVRWLCDDRKYRFTYRDSYWKQVTIACSPGWAA